MPRRQSPTPPTGLNFFGGRIRALRKQAGLRQEDMIARLQIVGWDITGPVYSTIETGKRAVSDYELKLLLEAIGVPWGSLDQPEKKASRRQSR